MRFSFPRSNNDLWANSTILKKASPYFKTQLESGFAEAVRKVVTYPGDTVEPDSASTLAFSDSDDEAATSAAEAPSKPEAKVHTVEVRAHSFTTYHAVWVWILTKRIEFAQLGSYSAPASPDAASFPLALQPAAKRRKTDAAPTATPAASPKSVYRLAHLLELDKLKHEALEAFKDRLRVANATDQLFSSTSASYDEVRTAAAQFVTRHWAEVSQTEAMKVKIAQIAAGELDHSARIVMALAQAALAKATQG